VLPGSLPLASGRQLDHVEVAYETYGTLDQTRSNAVLICHALSGDAHVAEGPAADGSLRPGWWDPVVGPGKAIDTRKYFVICSNVLGGCSGTTGPGSRDPKTGRPYGRRFPLVTVEDMVDVQARLLTDIGVERLASVTGGSMGGMQALAWAQRYPDRVASVMAIATTWRLGAQAIAFNEVGRTAILGDPQFRDGDYYDFGQPHHGLATARMIGHITYLSNESMRKKFGRRLRERDELAFDFVTEFEVESYLAYQGKKFVERFDANTYLYMTKAMDYFDVSAGRGSLAEAFGTVAQRYLVLSFSSDWLFTTRQSREIVDALQLAGAEVSFAEISSPYGHDAFLLEPEEQRRYVEPFLESVVDAERERARTRAAAGTGASAVAHGGSR
jgi:homoserine O-acetyltransferase